MTTDKRKAESFRKAPHLSEGHMARTLGYPENKGLAVHSAVHGHPLYVVQARDAEGRVVSEAATSSKVKQTADAIHGHVPKGGSLRLTSAEDAIKRRETMNRQGLASGGLSMGMADPWWTRRESSESIPHGAGFIASGIAGRTDRLPLAVAADSHIIPADVVAGLGQGNSLAGAHILSAALQVGPHGVDLPRMQRGPGPPRAAMPRVSIRSPVAEGGDPGTSHILAAGGEFVVPPEVVSRIGGGNSEKGHRVLDEMIKRVRGHAMKFLKNAPEPKK